MKIQLLKGAFAKTDALEIVTKLIQVKIQFHESKITSTDQEEDIKMREKRIKELQEELKAFRTYLETQDSVVKLESIIE